MAGYTECVLQACDGCQWGHELRPAGLLRSLNDMVDANETVALLTLLREPCTELMAAARLA